jgi:hypothetical protein
MKIIRQFTSMFESVLLILFNFAIYAGVSIFPSALYQLFPEIRGNFVFKFIAHTIASLIEALLVVCVIMMLYDTSEFGPLILLLIIIYGVGPGTILNITLQLALSAELTEPRHQTPTQIFQTNPVKLPSISPNQLVEYQMI